MGNLRVLYLSFINKEGDYIKQGVWYTEPCTDPRKLKTVINWSQKSRVRTFRELPFNRNQTVIYDSNIWVSSDPQYVLSSVPQGSVLGPLLFLIAYDGLDKVLIHYKIIMYADDTVIYTPDKSFSTIKSNLTEDFARVSTWLEENQLIVNLRKGKTECMLFTTSQRTKNKTLD